MFVSKRRITASVAAALAIGALASTTSAAAASGRPVAHSACTHATIAGESKCIARGQFCKRSAQSSYRRYGLSCSKLDANGRYHLR